MADPQQPHTHTITRNGPHYPPTSAPVYSEQHWSRLYVSIISASLSITEPIVV